MRDIKVLYIINSMLTILFVVVLMIICINNEYNYLRISITIILILMDTCYTILKHIHCFPLF